MKYLKHLNKSWLHKWGYPVKIVDLDLRKFGFLETFCKYDSKEASVYLGIVSKFCFEY